MDCLSNKLHQQTKPCPRLILLLRQAFKQRPMMEATLWPPLSDTGLQLTLPHLHPMPLLVESLSF